jgi:RimJ/RimL family protein N-acetyltransferase
VSALDAIPWPLPTERLVVRPAVPADAEASRRIRCLPGVSDWLGYRPGDPAAWAAQFGDPERLARTLVVEHGGVVVGDLMLEVRSPWAQQAVREQAAGREAALAWVLDPAHQGRGLATEAVRALVDAAFANLALHRVTAECTADNTASWRLMERLGMRREAHHVRAELYADGVWRDGLTYAVLAEEWRRSP